MCYDDKWNLNKNYSVFLADFNDNLPLAHNTSRDPGNTRKPPMDV